MTLAIINGQFTNIIGFENSTDEGYKKRWYVRIEDDEKETGKEK